MKPQVLTDGIIFIRPFQISDAEAHLEGEDEKQIRWLNGGKSSLEGIKKWIGKNQKYWESEGPIFNFAIVEVESNKLVGMVEVNTDFEKIEGLEKGDANISYGIYPFARGNGYSTRSIKLILKFLKSRDLKRAVIRVNPENIESLKIPKKCGFEEKGIIITRKGEKLTVFIKEI